LNQINLEKKISLDKQKEKIALLELTPRQLKLVFAWQIADTCFEVFDQYTEEIGIYKDIELDGFIKPTQVAECVELVKMYRKLCDDLGVQRAVAYATSGFRDAKNHYGFLEELEIASGFKIRLLQDMDEVVSVYNGVVNSLDAPKGVIMYVDDDYTHVIQYIRKSIINSSTIPCGSETLVSMYQDSKASPEQQMQEMTEKFLCKLSEYADWLKDCDLSELKLVGVGDTFESIGKISRKGKKYPLDLAHAYEMSQHDFDNVYNAIKALDFDKRSRIKGIKQRSANSVASGLAITRAFLEFLGASKFVISTSDISTGILFTQCVPITAEKPIVDIVGYSLNANLSFRENFVTNQLHVYEISALLFRQLRVMHKLGRQYLRPLKVACYMYDCGARLRYSPSRKDSLHVILNSQIYGLSHRDLVLAAFIASTQNADEFSLSEWVRYKDLVREEDLDAVRKLAAILKISVALDRSQQGHIIDLACDVLGDAVIMKTVTDGADIRFEVKTAIEASTDFHKVFGKNLEIL